MKKHKSFNTPEAYFANKKAALKAIAQEHPTHRRSNVIAFKPYLTGALAAAAMVVLAFFIWPSGEGSPATPQAPGISQIEDEAVLEYLSANASFNEFNYFMVEEEFMEENISLEDEEMMDYLKSQPLDFYNL